MESGPTMLLNIHYESCHDALEALLSAVAAELLARLASEMDELMQDWRSYKRAAALLDFDDLLYTARDLLARHEDIRQALARRFRHVLVDEFQDTDPLQIEIIWLLCGEACERSTMNLLGRALRPSALFLVGDPKQAIYRFRGADVTAYIIARTAIGNADLLQITANFRSVDPILSFVNHRFEQVLSEAAGQPGFSELSSIHRGMTGNFAVAALDIPDPCRHREQPDPHSSLPGSTRQSIASDKERFFSMDARVKPAHDGAQKPSAAMLRNAEAECVADACSRLIGNVTVRDEHADGGKRPCRPGDIALLAPTGTDLWRFEQALEDRGISVSTQAGKGFFRRQEVADLIALTRTLADAQRHARARRTAARPAGRAHGRRAPRHRRRIAAGPRPAGSPAVPRPAHRQCRGEARARALRAGSAAIAAPKSAFHHALRAPRRWDRRAQRTPAAAAALPGRLRTGHRQCRSLSGNGARLRRARTARIRARHAGELDRRGAPGGGKAGCRGECGRAGDGACRQGPGMAGRHPDQHDGAAPCGNRRDAGPTVERVLDAGAGRRTHGICGAQGAQ